MDTLLPFSVTLVDHLSLQFLEVNESTVSTSIPTVPIHSFFNKVAAIPASTLLPTLTPTALPPCTDIFASERCKCGQVAFNKVCTNKLYQKCCNKSMEYCGVTTYAQFKPSREKSKKNQAFLVGAVRRGVQGPLLHK
jgi:hypothetical protein